jgi:hypothetical protein
MSNRAVHEDRRTGNDPNVQRCRRAWAGQIEREHFVHMSWACAHHPNFVSRVALDRDVAWNSQRALPWDRKRKPWIATGAPHVRRKEETPAPESNGYASRALLPKWLVLLAVSRFERNQKKEPYLPGTR